MYMGNVCFGGGGEGEGRFTGVEGNRGGEGEEGGERLTRERGSGAVELKGEGREWEEGWF